MAAHGFAIAAQEPEMDRERVLDLLGKQFEGDYVGGAAEWLKNALDHAIRTDEPGEPVIVMHVQAPRGRKSKWMMETIDFLGTTYEEIDEHLKLWGSEIAASRGRLDWAGYGGHGNGGKFHMRENFRTSQFITYRDGRLTVFGFNEHKQYGFDERYAGTPVDPAEALAIAGIEPDALPVPQEIRENLTSGDTAKCHFSVVRGFGFKHARRWRKREVFDELIQRNAQAKQVLDRARVIYWSDTELIDALRPAVIERREDYLEGRIVELPAELDFEDHTYRLASMHPAGTLTMFVAAEPFHRNDPAHALDVKGQHGIVIASYRITELPIRNRVGADFIFGVLDSPALDDLGLRENARQHLVPNDITDAVIEWCASRIDDLSDELAAAENAKRKQRDMDATLALTSLLNRWKNKFLRASEMTISVGTGEGAGTGGSGGGGAGGSGPYHEGEGGSGDREGTGGEGTGGSGSDDGGGGSDEQQKKAPRFPEIRVSGFDPDPESGEAFFLHPRQPVVYQRPEDVERNLWWINAQRPLAERIMNEDQRGAEAPRWRDYVFNRFVEVIQAYDVRERYDGETDVAEFQWETLGRIHDSAAAELGDILFSGIGTVDRGEADGEGPSADAGLTAVSDGDGSTGD